MLQKCKAIVLKITKFSENSLIVNCYTDVFGKISFIAHGIHTQKSRNKAALYQLLSLLEVEIYFKNTREIQKIKEAKVSTPLIHLHFDIQKSSIAFFLAEIIFKTLREHENNPNLFHFIESSIKTLDLLVDVQKTANFHLNFLLQYARFLGFSPLNNFSTENCFFDLEAGKFMPQSKHSSYFLNSKQSFILQKLLLQSYHFNLEINRQQRTELLENLILFYNLHLNTKLTIKSLSVLTQLFND